MKKILLFTMLCLFGLFSGLKAQETTFSYNFNEYEMGHTGDISGWRTVDANSDGLGWQITPDVTTWGFMFVTLSGTYQPMFTGVDNTNCIISMSMDVKNTQNLVIDDHYVVTNDKYLITAGSKFSWNCGSCKFPNGPVSNELYKVVYSEDASVELSSWNVLSEKTIESNEFVAEEIEFPSDLVGKELYIGFLHYRSAGSGGVLRIDNIVLSAETTEDGGDDNTGDDNTGDDNTGDDNTGDDNTGDDNTGDDNTGDDNTGDDNTGDDNTGDDNTGDDNTGDDNTGDDNTGDDNTGDDNTGDDNTGDDNTGDDNTGDDNTGDDNTGDDNTGDDNTGDDNTGDDNTGDDNTGDDNTGDDNTGDDNTGDDNTGDGGTDDDEETVVLATPVVTAVATDSSVVLTWNKVEGAESYNIFQDTVAIDTVATPDTTYTVKGLLADSTYVFYVQAENADTVSAKSEKVSVKTLAKADDEEGDEEGDDHPGYLIYEDFEDYEVGAKLAATKPEIWSTWDNEPGKAEDAAVDSLNGNKYANLVYGVDQIVSLGDYTSGCYEISFDLYVPTGKNAYYNILHDFAGSNSDWAMQQYVHMTDDGQNAVSAPGHGTVHAGGNGVADITNFVFDTWMNILYVIDIDHDVAKFYFSTAADTAKKELLTWQWSKNSFDDQLMPNRKLDAMNFYPSTKTSGFYLDNFTLKRTSGESVVEVSFDTETVKAGALESDITSVEFTIENTGNSITDYIAWIDYGVSEKESEPFFVNYDADISDSTTVTALNASEPTIVEVGAMYPASSYASAAAGTKITHLSYPFAEIEAGSGFYGIVEGTPVIFRIYGQGFNGQPGEILAEKEVPYSEIVAGQFLTAEFDTAVVLTGFNVWATVSFTHPKQSQSNPSYPIAFDGISSGLAPYGDLIRIGNEGPFYFAHEAFQTNYGNIHIRMTCSGEAVLAGWAELGKVDGTLAPEATETINVDLSTFGLKAGEFYNATIKFALSNSEEAFDLPLTLQVWGENVEEMSSNNYSIYPNPTTGMVTVEGDNINYIAVYNSVGQLVKVVKTQDNIVDMSACENGVYFFNVVDNNNQTSVQRVVVAK